MLLGRQHLRVARLADDDSAPAPAAAASRPPAETRQEPASRSVFASLVSGAAPDRLLAEPTAPAEARDGTPAILPLAAIGFGPGMLLRLGQLGLHTTADLARADAEQLRAELGGISRLVDVEGWVAQARQMVARA